jgi:osmoprotectant transport system ATP-binding protein
VRETVTSVAHDIDEAAKVGGRIAVLREGSVLVQDDVSARILAQPADDVVPRVPGANRGLKEIVSRGPAESELNSADLAGPEEAQVLASTTPPDALSPLLSARAGPLVVIEGKGCPLGQVAVARIGRILLGPE